MRGKGGVTTLRLKGGKQPLAQGMAAAMQFEARARALASRRSNSGSRG